MQLRPARPSVTGCATLLFGLLPALRTSRVGLAQAMQEGGARAGTTHGTLDGGSRQQLLDRLAEFQVGFISRWFPKVSRRPKSGALLSVIRGVRGRDNNNRSPAASLAFADVREHFHAARFWKI